MKKIVIKEDEDTIYLSDIDAGNLFGVLLRNPMEGRGYIRFSPATVKGDISMYDTVYSMGYNVSWLAYKSTVLTNLICSLIEAGCSVFEFEERNELLKWMSEETPIKV